MLHNPVNAEYNKPLHELKLFRDLFRLYMTFVIISKPDLKKLQQIRIKYRKVKVKLDVIRKTMATCEGILSCDSINHDNPRGCPKCGVTYRGGELDKTMYVTSISRDTGVKTLVTLDFELDTLVREDATQSELLRKIDEELLPLQSRLYLLAVVQLQRWLGFVLAFKRGVRLNRARMRSLLRMRHRRLVLLKREVDSQVRRPEPLDQTHFRYRYSDIPQETAEHLLAVTTRKTERIQRASCLLRDNLLAAVLASRQRRLEELLLAERLAELERSKEKPLVLKTVPLEPRNKKKLMCFRTECKLRTFLSVDRYETHMKLHRIEDAKKKEHQQLCHHAKLLREADEAEFLQKVRDSRAFVLQESDRMDYSGHEKEFSPVDLSSGAQSSMLQLTFPSFRNEKIGKRSESGPNPNLELSSSSPPLVTDIPHIFAIFNLHYAPLFSLELVSKQDEVSVPFRVPLDRPVVRIGTHESCECVVGLSGIARKESKISTIHCLFYCSMDGNIASNSSSLSSVTLVDNSTSWGTYFVNTNGTRKVPPKMSAGLLLSAGCLVCVGVQRDGPAVLPAEQASAACAVYRVRCLERETD